MLSAVESSSSSHLGSNHRAYNVHHHHAYGGVVVAGGGGVSAVPSISAGTGINCTTYPTNVVPAMSAAEFVKPHPKLSRYSLPGRSLSSNGMPSPGSSGGASVGKFKYASEQPVNLSAASQGSPSSSVNGSPQQVQQPGGVDKLKPEFDLMKSAGHLPPGSFADFIYSRHAAVAAAGFLNPQNYPAMMYSQAAAAASSSMYNNDQAANGRRSLSPGKNHVDRLGRSNSDSLVAFHHMQRSPGGAPPPNGMSFGQHPSPHPLGKGGDGNSSMSPPIERNGSSSAMHMSPSQEALMNSHHRYHQHQQMQQQQQKSSKGPPPPGNGTGFMLPPPSSMMPTQAELEAYHAYHQGAVERLYYNGHSQEHLMAAQQAAAAGRLHPQQQQSLPPPPPPVSQQQQIGSGKQRAIHMVDGGDPYPGHPQHHHRLPPQQQNGGGAEGRGKGGSSQQDKNNNIGFKVPSGKEGSLKHRLLNTRGTKEGKRKQNGSRNNASYGTSNIVKSNFNKGVLIELGSGELKRVEDMRTEDFILSSNVTPDLELIDSTVLRIAPQRGSVVLTLSNAPSKMNVDLNVAPEHPFFVYRQGWASCNPEGTYQMHGLKCRRLEVGDVCISLRHKERAPLTNGEPSSSIEDNLKAVRITSGSSSSSSSTSSVTSASSSLSSPPPSAGGLPQQLQQQPQQQPPPLPDCQQEEPQNLSRRPSPLKDPRGLIEGTTHHPSLKASPSASSSSASGPSVSSSHLASHSIASVGSCSSSSSASNGQDLSQQSTYPSPDHPQPLHALLHGHINHHARPAEASPHGQMRTEPLLHSHAAQQQHHHHPHEHMFRNGGHHSALSVAPPQPAPHTTHNGHNNHPLMDSILSTLKHNYLAAFEHAAAMNGGGAQQKLGGGGGISHSIKNIVMGGGGGGGDDSSTVNGHQQTVAGNYSIIEGRHPQYSPPSFRPQQQQPNLSPGSSPSSSNKRRYSAPDNIFGDEPKQQQQQHRDDRFSHDEPPKKIPSH